MRLLLNNYHFIARTLAQNRYYLSTAPDHAHDTQPIHQQNTDNPADEHAVPKASSERKDKQFAKNSRGHHGKNRRRSMTRDSAELPQMLQNEYELSADHLMQNSFHIVKTKPEEDLARKHLKEYQQSLGLNMDILKSKLYNEQYYQSRLAEFHLNSVTPLTKNFLNQGINFLNKDSFYKLIQSNKIRVLRELLENGAFENVDFVSPKVIRQLFQMQYYDDRNEFLLNVLNYESSLVKGEVGMKDKMLYKNMRMDMERLRSRLTRSQTLNKLRLLWSFSKLYLYQNNLIGDIIHELSKVSFRDSVGELLAVKKESNFICSLAFSPIPFNTFISKLLKQAKTFGSFIRAYSLSIILLSKLLSIPHLLSDKNSNELHPVLQLIQFNLPKHQKNLLLSKFILQLLSHEDHSRIHYQNYKRCYNYWLKDYSLPSHSNYNSPLSLLLQKSKEPLTIVYEQRSDVSNTARSIITLNRQKTVKNNLAIKTQSQIINYLLKGKYQQVLDYFMTTFALNTDPQLASKFADAIKNIDKTQCFRSKDEEALLKLKVATQIFFRDSLPKPLNSDYLQTEKEHFITMSVLEQNPKFSSMPINIDRKFKSLKYKMMLADNTMTDKPRPKEDESVEAPLTEQSLQPIFQYLSLILDEPEAQLAALAGASSLLKSQNNQLVEGEQDNQESIPDTYEQIVDDEEYEVQQQGLEGEQFDDDSSVIIRAAGTSPLLEREHIKDHQLVQFDEAYFQLGTQKSKPKSKFKTEYKTQEGQRSQQQYKFNKKRTGQQTAEQPKFFSKNKNQFSTTKPLIVRRNIFEFSTEVQPLKQVEIAEQNLFDFQHIQQYRTKPIDQNFLQLMKSEVNIPQIGSGTNIAKYLFLHSKKEGGLSLNANRTLNIEFMSSIGTRTTNYEKYVGNSLFNYELDDDFYEQMLLDQLKTYNRFQFKQIVAHLLNFKQTLRDSIINTLCQICQKEAIGYTFVEIAQFIKVNAIVISSAALQRVTRTWYKFDIINEDMLSFLREYCHKMQISMQTQYYASYCKSLIKTGNFDKLQLVCTAILVQIRPKPFRVESSMKLQAVSALEKQWKEKEQENYIKLFFELIEVIVNSLENKVPTYMDELFNDYKKLKPVLNEKELGYAFVCYCQKRPQFEQLLTLLENNGEKGTSFMYDCLLKALLSNFSPLQDLSEKMLEATVFKNRIILSNNQISQSLVVFKRSSSANSFSSFLQHCLRFQEDIHTVNEIKREMYYILNNNVNEVSVSGVYNLLDFIFNQKREKERHQYRKIKLSEEEKQRKLQEIQQAKTKSQDTTTAESTATDKKQSNKKKRKEQDFQQFSSSPKKQATTTPAPASESDKKQNQKTKKPVRVSQKQRKQNKKEIALEKKYRNRQIQSYLDEQYEQTVTDSQSEEVIQSIRNSDSMSRPAQRGCIKLMDGLYGAAIESMEQEEEERAKISEQAKTKQELQTDDKKGGKGGKGKAKGKK